MCIWEQQVDGVTEIEVGYHVRVCLQGRGLATEAGAACRDYARDVLEVDRLIAIIDPHNQPSQRVAENLGLVVSRTSDNHDFSGCAGSAVAVAPQHPAAAAHPADQRALIDLAKQEERRPEQAINVQFTPHDSEPDADGHAP
jgi:hypothetical protein